MKTKHVKSYSKKVKFIIPLLVISSIKSLNGSILNNINIDNIHIISKNEVMLVLDKANEDSYKTLMGFSCNQPKDIKLFTLQDVNAWKRDEFISKKK